MYNCPKCNIELIKGLEYQYPPRLFYWYCPLCQRVYKKNQESIEYIGDVENHKEKCIQDLNVSGFILNTVTGEKSYPKSV